MKRFELTVLGGKYLRNGKSESPGKKSKKKVPPVEDKNDSNNSSRQQKPIDWSTTPVYKQFVLKVTEMESLKDSGLGFRKNYKLDIGDPKVRQKLLEQALANIYGETEIEYVIKILKEQISDSQESSERKDELVSIYAKALDTLEVLMTKMGLKDQFDRVVYQYDE